MQRQKGAFVLGRVLTHFCADINHQPVPTPDLQLLTSWSEGISNAPGQL